MSSLLCSGDRQYVSRLVRLVKHFVPSSVLKQTTNGQSVSCVPRIIAQGLVITGLPLEKQRP